MCTEQCVDFCAQWELVISVTKCLYVATSKGIAIRKRYGVLRHSDMYSHGTPQMWTHHMRESQ